jgi:hypothetical protein
MRIVALIDQADVIERILRHLGLWEAGVRVDSARDPPQPAEPIIEAWLEDPFPDYDHEPVFAQNREQRQRRGAPRRPSFSRISALWLAKSGFPEYGARPAPRKNQRLISMAPSGSLRPLH